MLSIGRNNSYAQTVEELQNNMEETADNNILINKENNEDVKKEVAGIIIKNLGNNPIFKHKIEELKEIIKQ